MLACRGCFDSVAKSELTFFVKRLKNANSLTKNSADDLKLISKIPECFSIVVAEKFNYEKLEDGIVYERHELPVVNKKTFRGII